MSRPERELGALLERGRTIRPVSSSIRDRVITRAREAASVRRSPLEGFDVSPRRWSVRAIALVAALVAGVASASLGLSWRWSAPAPQPATNIPTPAAQPAAPAPASVPAPSAEREPEVIAAPPAVARATRPAPASPARASYADELELLQRAHASYKGGDFASALGTVAEHSRRFPSSVLAEQREALKVRSLAREGRSAESKRAAEAFAKRFPRSVLLPQLEKLSTD